MASIQFPASPTNPETVIRNGVAYTWNGSFWEANTQNSEFDERYVEKVGDNMTGDLTLGTDKIRLDATGGGITAIGTSQSGRFDATGGGIDNSAIRTFDADGNQVFRAYGTGGVWIGDPTSTGNIQLNGNGSSLFAGSAEFGKGKSGETVSVNDALSIETSNASGKSRGLSIYGNSDIPSTYEALQIRGDGDPVISAKYDGSITAAGNVTLSGDATKYLIAPNVIADSGYTGAKQSLNGDSFTQTATDGSTTTVTIAADGSVTAVGKIQSGGSPSDGNNAGAYLRQDGNISAARGSNDAIWAGYNTDNPGNTATSIIRGNGSIASGDLNSTSGGVLISDGQIYARPEDGRNNVITVYKDGSSSANEVLVINADGSATFAGEIQTSETDATSQGVRVMPKGKIIVNGAGDCIVVNNSVVGGTQVTLSSDGNVTGKNFLTGAYTQGQTGAYIAESGECASYVTTSDAHVFRGWNTSGSSNELIFNILGNGSATFGNPGSGASEIGVEVGAASGHLYIYADANVGTSNNFRMYNSDGTEVVKFACNGDAEFTGDVRSNGSILTRAGGTTLDVGQRLDAVAAFKESLKTSITAATDLASVKTAILDALEELTPNYVGAITLG